MGTHANRMLAPSCRRPAALCVLLLLLAAAVAAATGAAATGGRFSVKTLAPGSFTLLGPDGEPTFLLALNHLAPPFYAGLITGASGLHPCHAFDTACLKADLFAKQYSSNWSAATADFVRRSKSWAFTSAGYEYVPAPGVSWPYIPDLFITNASHIMARSTGASFPDVFSATFNQSTDTRVGAWIARDQHIDLPRRLEDVVGYYFEDQALWNVSMARSSDPEGAAPLRSTPGDWVAAMRALEPTAPGKAAYVDWLQQHYTTRGGLSAARKIYALPPAVSSWADLRDWDFAGLRSLDPAVISDDDVFLGVVAERYFSLAAAAVRRHDPDGLVLGQRFLGNDTPRLVMEAAGRHFDVISVQPAPFSFGNVQEARLSAGTISPPPRPPLLHATSQGTTEPALLADRCQLHGRLSDCRAPALLPTHTQRGWQRSASSPVGGPFSSPISSPTTTSNLPPSAQTAAPPLSTGLA